MQINKEVLKSLNPCADRYKHFLKHNASFDGSLSEFLDLPNLAYSDKVWVAEKVLTKNKRVKWAILCAESVMYIFEAKYPDDKSLSDCINYLKTVNDFDDLTYAEKSKIEKHLDIIEKALPTYASYATGDVNYAAHSAIYAAYYAATSATTSDTTSASSAAQAARFATEFATESAFYAAKNAGENFTAAKHNQLELNIKFLKQVISL